MTLAHSAGAIVALALANLSTTAGDEYQLQEHLAKILEPLGLRREFDLPGFGRVDFFQPETSLAVEIKMNGAAYDVAKQLDRYVLSPSVGGVVLVTTVQAHVALANPPRLRVVLVRRFP